MSAGDSGARASTPRTSAASNATVVRVEAIVIVTVGPHGAADVHPVAQGKLHPSLGGACWWSSDAWGAEPMSMPGMSGIPAMPIMASVDRAHIEPLSDSRPSPNAKTFSIRRNRVADAARRSMPECMARARRVQRRSAFKNVGRSLRSDARTVARRLTSGEHTSEHTIR